MRVFVSITTAVLVFALSVAVTTQVSGDTIESRKTELVPAESPDPSSHAPAQNALVSVKILAINDLHGALDSQHKVAGVPIGGAAYLAAHLKARAASSPNSIVVGAGDLYGASGAVSALLNEEPTVRAVNEMGLRLNSPGNHELDQGIGEFMRLTKGGCSERGCFEGSRYKQISSNIVVEATGEPLLDPYEIVLVDGVPIAFIGAVHRDVAAINLAGTVDGLVFLDPASAVNRYVHELEQQGVHAFVVLIHEGGWMNDRGELAGPIVPILEALDPAVSLVVSAHTHQMYAVRHDGRLVTQGFADGAAFVDIDLVIDRSSDSMVHSSAEVITTWPVGIEPDARVQAIVREAHSAVESLISRQVGSAAEEMSKLSPSSAGETTLGNLIADSQRWKVATDFAFMNLFSIRAAIEPGPVTWGDLFRVEAYRYELVTMSMTGRQLYSLLNQQWSVDASGAEVFRPLQVSGLNVVWDASRPRGQRIVSVHTSSGQAIDHAASYSVVANAFIAGGGDGYTEFLACDARYAGVTDVDALVEYVEQLPQPFTASIDGRIRRLR